MQNEEEETLTGRVALATLNAMRSDELKIPPGLSKLIENGFWPTTIEAANRQNLHPLVEPGRVRQLRPRESSIYFYPPPFSTVAQTLETGDTFFVNYGSLQQIVPEKCLVIGDFGLGSDAPLVLNYAQNPADPRVLALKWNVDRSTKWICCADDFDEFVSILGLGII